MTGDRVDTKDLSPDALRMRKKRAAYGGSLPTDKARNAAVVQLIKNHSAEFDELVRRARKRYEKERSRARV